LIYGKPVRVNVLLTDASGKPVPGQVVNFALDNTSLADLTNSGAVLTDSNGTGNLTISANAPSSQGALTLTATATVNGANPGTATAAMSFRINATAITSPAGTPAFLQYVSTTPTRLFVAGGAQGNNNAAEQAITTFKVLDKDSNAVPGAQVWFDVTKRNDGGGLLPILTNGSSSAVLVAADSNGVASVTVKSGDRPLSINVIAWLPANPTVQFWSNDQIVISSSRPDQRKLLMNWASGSSCLKVDRTWPCDFVITVGDENGQPVADGTVVNLVSDTGVIVADILAGQPAGSCLTVNAQCTGHYFGNSAFPLGEHRLIAYAVGVNAPPGKPVTKDGSWIDNLLTGIYWNVIVNVPDSNNYIRNCLPDVGNFVDADGNLIPSPQNKCRMP